MSRPNPTSDSFLKVSEYNEFRSLLFTRIAVSCVARRRKKVVVVVAAPLYNLGSLPKWCAKVAFLHTEVLGQCVGPPGREIG